MKTYRVLFILFFAMAIALHSHAQETDDNPAKDDLLEMSLEELMNINITSASNVDESLSRAPATIIIITAKEIEERGYTEFYDVLNDLPGFDLSRAFGDDNYYLYARGYRKETSDQMLFMIDGIAMNHLYSNNMNLFGMYPLSNIQQVEVVYGPASAIYGPNAFAGVINIITKKEGNSTVSMHYGDNNTLIADMNYNKKINDVNISFTGRFYDSDGYDFSNRTSALDARLFNDTTLWGPFANTGFTGYQSPINSHFLSGSMNYKGLTLGFINFLYESGYGAEWPGDKVLNAESWGFDEMTYFAKYEAKLKVPSATNPINSKTLLKYRQSGHPSNSLFLERYSGGVDASYWQTTNQSVSFFQDFSYTHDRLFSVNAGIKYDRRILQGQYNENYGPFFPSDSMVSYPFPELPNREITQHNHFMMQDYGAYAQLKLTPIEQLDIITGLRYDKNSIFGDVLNPRLGMVYEPIDGLVSKIFYGQAYLEPTARILYGGWQGSLSNVDLKPERIRTYEASVAYAKGKFSNSINAFYNQGYDVIAGAENVGERRMMGVEYAGKVYMNDPVSFIHRLRADLYVSYINSEENRDDGEGWNPTGNMAPIKIKAIITANFTKDLSLSLQNRWIDEIETVESNPIDKIDAYFVTDAFLAYNNIGVEGLSVGVKVYNVFDTEYFHPGYRDASAGENFVFDANGQLDEFASGSQGWYNSRLPQPLRTFMLNVRLTF
ncbi:MAG: TonB-dependent receptor [Salinivirgaceae bacterium]|jgi:outer membrane receptor for ferrienterochelin and colicins|nr:TonB-dependent receptor [Salinivirgaceae bacterium]